MIVSESLASKGRKEKEKEGQKKKKSIIPAQIENRLNLDS